MNIRVMRRLAGVLMMVLSAGLVACGGGSDDSTACVGAACGGGSGASDPPVIVAQPDSISTLPGVQALIQVKATGTPALSYQWRRNGQPIAGADSSVPFYRTPSLAAADNGAKYSVVVTNAFGSVTSGDAVITIGPNAGVDLMHLVYYANHVSAGGASPLSLLADEKLVARDPAQLLASGTAKATLNGGAFPAAGQQLPLTGTLAATFINARDDSGSVFNGFDGAASVQYQVTTAVNPFNPDQQPITGSATTTATKMHVLGSLSGSTMDVDYTADGVADVTFSGSSKGTGTDLSQLSTCTPHAGATLSEAASGLKATFASGSIATDTLLSPIAGSPSPILVLAHLKVTYSALTFSAGGVDYVANGSFIFQPLTGSTATGSGEVVVTQNGNKVGRIFADSKGVHIDVNGQIFKI